MTTRNPEPANRRSDLQELQPREAIRLWKESKVDEVARATFELQASHVDQFGDWIDGEGITDMRDVTARTVYQFRMAIKDDIAQSTLSQRISTVRRFLKFCASIDGVSQNVVERIELPNRDTEARTESLESEQAEATLEYLQRFSYASREHALLLLCWHTAIRTGTLRSLDVGDFDADRNRLRVRHRPETDTPLKNGQAAERYIALSDDVTMVLRDYIQNNRPDVTDDYDRVPLFATKNGRASINTLRRWFETATRPCMYGECPHDRDPSDCEAARGVRQAGKCPSSVSGHPVRRGSITHHLRRDVPEKVVSDRCNVSSDVLDKHYDQRTESEKTEARRQHLEGI